MRTNLRQLCQPPNKIQMCIRDRYEDCCTIFVAKHPVTKPSIRVIERSEHHLADVIDEMMEEAVRSREVIVCESDI